MYMLCCQLCKEVKGTGTAIKNMTALFVGVNAVAPVMMSPPWGYSIAKVALAAAGGIPKPADVKVLVRLHHFIGTSSFFWHGLVNTAHKYGTWSESIAHAIQLISSSGRLEFAQSIHCLACSLTAPCSWGFGTAFVCQRD